jgi:hypothetical protein
MDATGTIVSVVGGVVSTVVAVVGYLLRRSISQIDDSVKAVGAKVEGHGDRLTRIEEKSEGRHVNTMRLMEEHGSRIARLEDRPSGQRKGLR